MSGPIGSCAVLRLGSFVLVVSIAASTVACSKARSPAACADPTRTTAVEMKDFSFTPACVQAEAGTKLTITDSGIAPHTFTVPGTDVNVSLGPGGEATADLTGIAPGTYAVVCTYHPQMKGTLEIG